MSGIHFVVDPNGKLPKAIAKLLSDKLKKLAGKHCVITLSAKKPKRSLKANAFYWSAVIPTVMEFRGNQGDVVTPEQAHEDLLAEFSPKKIRYTLKNEPVVTYMRSSDLEMDVERFSTYIRNIEVRLNEFNCYFPVKYEDLPYETN